MMVPTILEVVVVAAIVVVVMMVTSTIVVPNHLHQARRRLDAPCRRGGRRLGCQCRRGEAHESASHRGNERVLHQLCSLRFFQPGVAPKRSL
jgi:hypothetical protein